MNKPLRVGVFGYYSYRNLGDNLMAYLLSEHVKRAGHVPVVFSKLSVDMQGWGVEVCSDARELVEKSDLLLFGGGGLLIPRRKLSSQGADFNDDLRAVLAASANKGIPAYGLSIGGGGKPLDEIVPEERRNLIRSLHYVTLRNREDLQLLEQAGVRGEFLDDLVWTTASCFPVAAPAGKNRRRIGINLYLGRSRRFNLLRKVIELFVRIRPDIDFVFLDIHPGSNGEFRAYAPGRPRKNCAQKRLVDVEDACREAASLDLLFTTRLHLGVMAMCYGVTTVAYAGQEKTRLLYNRIGRGDLFWKSSEIFNFIKLFFLPGRLEKLFARREAVGSEIVENAMRHYARLDDVLAAEADGSRYAGPGGKE